VLLVDLDRIDAAVAALVPVLLDRGVEAAEQGRHPAVEDVGEAHQERQTESAPFQVEHQLVEIDAAGVGARRGDLDASRVVDAEYPPDQPPTL